MGVYRAMYLLYSVLHVFWSRGGGLTESIRGCGPVYPP